MSDHLMISSLASQQISEHSALALAEGLAQPGRTIIGPDRCDYDGNHIPDCDCGMDEGD